MNKRTSEPLPLDSNGQENIRTTSSGQRWTRQHQSYFLWTAMDKTTSELLCLDSDGQENIRDLWTAMDKTTSEISGHQWTRQHQSYFLCTATDKRTAELFLLDSNAQDSFRATSSGQQWTRLLPQRRVQTTEKHTSSSTESEGCWCCSRVTRLLP